MAKPRRVDFLGKKRRGTIVQVGARAEVVRNPASKFDALPKRKPPVTAPQRRRLPMTARKNWNSFVNYVGPVYTAIFVAHAGSGFAAADFVARAGSIPIGTFVARAGSVSDGFVRRVSSVSAAGDFVSHVGPSSAGAFVARVGSVSAGEFVGRVGSLSANAFIKILGTRRVMDVLRKEKDLDIAVAVLKSMMRKAKLKAKQKK